MSLVKDISTITKIPESTLQELLQKSLYCICHQVNECDLKGNNISLVDIGIGKLYIIIDGNDISYQFIPSEALVKTLR